MRSRRLESGPRSRQSQLRASAISRPTTFVDRLCPNLVERLFGLTHEQVNPNELVLDIGALVGVPAYWPERDRALAFRDRLCLPAQVGQGETPEDMPLPVLGRCPELPFESEPCRVGVDPRLGRISAQLIG